jgi:glycosyltransferase involved in cell wall biosynthesis
VCSNPELAEQWSNLDIGRVRLVRSTGKGRVTSRLVFMRELARLADCILVVFESDLLPLVWLVNSYLKHRRVVRVVDLHNVYTSSRGLRRLQRYTRDLDGVIAVSRFAAAQVTGNALMEVVQRPMRGVSGCKMLEAGDRYDGFTVGIIGRLDPDKNVELGIAAVGMARSKPIVVVRGKSSKQEFENYASEVLASGRQTLGERFIYDGAVPQEKVMEGIDVLLFLNSAEPSGRVVAGAQMCGVPVLCPAAGGSAEFVECGRSGFLYVPDDPSSLADVLDKVSSHESEFERLRKTTRESAADRFDFECQVALYAQAIDRFVAHSS